MVFCYLLRGKLQTFEWCRWQLLRNGRIWFGVAIKMGIVCPEHWDEANAALRPAAVNWQCYHDLLSEHTLPKLQIILTEKVTNQLIFMQNWTPHIYRPVKELLRNAFWTQDRKPPFSRSVASPLSGSHCSRQDWRSGFLMSKVFWHARKQLLMTSKKQFRRTNIAEKLRPADQCCNALQYSNSGVTENIGNHWAFGEILSIQISEYLYWFKYPKPCLLIAV